MSDLSDFTSKQATRDAQEHDALPQDEHVAAFVQRVIAGYARMCGYPAIFLLNLVELRIAPWSTDSTDPDVPPR
jgi:hypothetical protein